MQIKEPAVAGQFYPVDPVHLRRMIKQCLAHAKSVQKLPKAIIAPHAGYIYSGPIAGSAYAILCSMADTIKRVVILGPAHREYVSGVAVHSAEAFATPLGAVSVDHQWQDLLADLSYVKTQDSAFQLEHCLEVQLPFLQTLLGEFTWVPMLVGDAKPEQVSEVLERLWGGADTLIIISSDLSHYHDYVTAQQMDRAASIAIEALDPNAIRDDQACGRLPIKGLLLQAAKRGMQVKALDLRNSGDTAGSKDRVVGYGAYHVY